MCLSEVGGGAGGRRPPVVPRPRILARVAPAAGESTRRARESGRPRYLEEGEEQEQEEQEE